MLRHILGHWKAHKRKPSLLPEDLESPNHSDDPSKINPIFEDSEGSIASSRRHDTDSPTGDRDSTGGVDLDLVDVSVPLGTHEAVLEENPDDVINQINLALDDSFLDDKEGSDEQINNTTELKDAKDLSSAVSETIDSKNMVPEKSEPVENKPRVSRLHQIVNSHPQLKKELTSEFKVLQNVPSFSKKATVPIISEKSEPADIQKENVATDISAKINGASEQIAIPSTSTGITSNSFNNSNLKQVPDTKINTSTTTTTSKNELIVTNKESETLSSTDLDSNKPSSSTTTKANESSVSNKGSKPLSSTDGDSNQPHSTITTKIKESSSSNKGSKELSATVLDSGKISLDPQPVSGTKQKSNFKKRAIDELIKKFQSSNSGDSSPFQKVSSFLHSSNKENISEETKEKKESQISPLSKEQEKESLSKIFNFPPPPPVESKTKNFQNAERSSKETKISSSETVSKINSNFILKEAKTRTDSSLSRNKTVASKETGGNTPSNKPIGSENTKETESGVKKVTEVVAEKTTSSIQQKSVSQESKKEKDLAKESNSTNLKEKISPQTKTDSKLHKEAKSDKITPGPAGKQFSSNVTAKALTEKKTQNAQKTKQNLAKSNTDTKTQKTKENPAKSSRSPETKRKSSTSKKSSEDPNENDVTKSHSEDSGITRGDQISSEASPDNPKVEPHQEKETEPTPVKRNSRERRTFQSRNKNCKRCKRHSYDGEASLKKGLCDDYYDILTGIHRSHKSKYSDSWTSDLSREEKDLIRRLRSKRDTFRSNGPMGKTRHSRRARNRESGHFHRHHAIRRSISDESTLNGSSMCSCDDCWLFLVKDYAYGRASLRGLGPDRVLCTCRPGRADILGRRVKFRSDTIPEVSLSDRTVTSIPIPEESSKNEDATDTRSTSNLSSMSHDSITRNGKVPDKTAKKGKNMKEPTYRLVTPWELEEWDLVMKRHLLKKRRKRARYMGFMALAMVVFVGLVVAILMVYLRRKVL